MVRLVLVVGFAPVMFGRFFSGFCALFAVFRQENLCSAPRAGFVVNGTVCNFVALTLRCCSLSRLAVAVGCMSLVCKTKPQSHKATKNTNANQSKKPSKERKPQKPQKPKSQQGQEKTHTEATEAKESKKPQKPKDKIKKINQKKNSTQKSTSKKQHKNLQPVLHHTCMCIIIHACL